MPLHKNQALIINGQAVLPAKKLKLKSVMSTEEIRRLVAKKRSESENEMADQKSESG